MELSTHKGKIDIKMASVTTTLLKSRVSKPTLGKWSSGFSACKKYALDNNIPFIAVWSNGDKCGHCVMFETAVTHKTFKAWMAESKCIFWFGYYGDTSKDDKFEGTGFTWTRNGKLTTYPFVRVYWKPGKVDTYKSGDDWTGASAKGYNTFIKKLKKLLAKYYETPQEPEVEPEPPVVDDGGEGGTGGTNPPECDGSCEVGNCDCDALKNEISSLNAKIEGLEKEVDTLHSLNDILVGKIDEMLPIVEQLTTLTSKLKEMCIGVDDATPKKARLAAPRKAKRKN